MIRQDGSGRIGPAYGAQPCVRGLERRSSKTIGQGPGRAVPGSKGEGAGDKLHGKSIAYDVPMPRPGPQGWAVSAAVAPLIVTATLPSPVQGWAEGLRRAHFPPDRNVLAAHVTLFHALPGFVLDEARGLLAALAKDSAPIEAQIERVMDLGRGTAFAIASPKMLDMRAMIAEHFHGLLTQQDQQRPRLHVTVQNKVTTVEARALQATLGSAFQRREFTFAGLELHHYRGGPWEAAGVWRFRGRG